jgi:ribosome-binding protein aMBF1 (putative translation factor)
MPTSKKAPDKEGSKTPIGAWLNAARKRRNTTQDELARALHIEQSMIAMVENGDLEPAPELRQKLQKWIQSGSRPGSPPKRGPYAK